MFIEMHIYGVNIDHLCIRRKYIYIKHVYYIIIIIIMIIGAIYYYYNDYLKFWVLLFDIKYTCYSAIGINFAQKQAPCTQSEHDDDPIYTYTSSDMFT